MRTGKTYIPFKAQTSRFSEFQTEMETEKGSDGVLTTLWMIQLPDQLV
jgi:hypothetical protein